MYLGHCQPSKGERSHLLGDGHDLLQEVKANPTDVQLMVSSWCNVFLSDDGCAGEAGDLVPNN